MNPDPATTAPSESRVARSKRFLEDYLADRRMRALPAGRDVRLPPGSVLAPPRPFSDNPLEPGQIRLLSQLEEPTYVVVLRRWERGSFLIAPFSRFGEPATDEELRTRFDGGLRMRVLQLWNVRSALSATLRRSWFAGFLPDGDLRDALRVWRRSIGDGDPLPPGLADRTGTPVFRVDDPRLDYRREALRAFEPFDRADDLAVETLVAAREARERDGCFVAACREAAGDAPPPSVFPGAAAFRRVLPKIRRKVSRAMPLPPGPKNWLGLYRELFLAPAAAADADRAAPAGRRFGVRLAGSAEDGLELRVARVPPAGAFRFEVLDAAGRPSRRLDGCLLVRESDDSGPAWDLPSAGEFCDFVADGRLEVRFPGPSFRFWLVSPDAEPVGLVPKGGT